MAANNTAINNIYNYYLTTYAPKSTTKFDTHKKSELRGVYNSIVKLNKEDSLYIVDKSQETKEYAIGLKENARAFRNTIASLGGLSDEELLNKKTASSSNESIASAVYIGENSNEEVPSFNLSVSKLATVQENEGKMIPSNQLSLSEDTYSFDIGINGLNYEFQYNVRPDDTNKSLQEKLARLITNAGIGLEADVVEDGNGNSALSIKSVNTGSVQDGGNIFNVSDNNTSKTSGSVNYFGIDNIKVQNSDSEFYINGEARHASGNTFTVEKIYEVTLNGLSASEEDSTTIDLKPDIESMAANITSLIDGYNSFVDNADKYSENHPKSQRLVREMSAIASLHADELSAIGVSLDPDGRIALDSNKLQEAVSQGTVEDSFSALKAFTGSMLRKTNDVSLNPMNYADRTVVAYKNPGHNFAAPYVASPYTGMMFNSYC